MIRTEIPIDIARCPACGSSLVHIETESIDVIVCAAAVGKEQANCATGGTRAQFVEARTKARAWMREQKREFVGVA